MAPAGYEPLLELKGDAPELEGHAPRTPRTRRKALTLIALLGVVGFSAFYTLAPSKGANYAAQGSLGFDADADDQLAKCPSGLPPAATPPAKVNPFASLTIADTVSVSEWLLAPERGLNLTRGDKAPQLADNLIYHVDAFRPVKKDAVAYLDNPDTVSPPERFARVTIHHGAAPEPYVMDYLVGPLPVSEKTTMRKLTEIYHRDSIPFNARGYTTMSELSPLLTVIMPPLSEVTEVSRLNAKDDLPYASTLTTMTLGPFRRLRARPPERHPGCCHCRAVEFRRCLPPWLGVMEAQHRRTLVAPRQLLPVRRLQRHGPLPVEAPQGGPEPFAVVVRGS